VVRARYAPAGGSKAFACGTRGPQRPSKITGFGSSG
jgi:hypothetical protein